MDNAPRKLRQPQTDIVLTVQREQVDIYRVLSVDAPDEHGPWELLVDARFTSRALRQFAQGLACERVAAYAVREYHAPQEQAR